MSKAEEFYKEYDPENRTDDDDNVNDWLFSKTDMMTFAEAYHQSRLKEVIEKEQKRLWKVIPDASNENPTNGELINLGRYMALESLENKLKQDQ